MPIDHALERKANAVLYFAANTQHCTKTNLMRLLFLLDFEHFRQTGRSVTDESYLALADGPAPALLYRNLHQPANLAGVIGQVIGYDAAEDVDAVVPLVEFNADDLTPRQLKILAEVTEMFGDDAGERLEAAVTAPGGAVEPDPRRYTGKV